MGFATVSHLILLFVLLIAVAYELLTISLIRLLEELAVTRLVSPN